MAVVLVIDDDRAVCHMIARTFQDSDVQVHAAGNAEVGMHALRQHKPDVVLLDIALPEVSGLELYQQICALDNKLPVIFITASDSSETAIRTMSLGAYDYLVKPLDVARIQTVVRQAIDIRRLMNIPVRAGSGDSEIDGNTLVGRSPQMLDVYKGIGRVARQDVTVLIRGESGTGKELVARAIFHHSLRSDGPFVAVNCAAIPDTLLESELFGHEKGAFTGADQRRIGKFEQCSGGTIFLDEIGDMTPLVQSKMLRVLQEQQFERLGSNHTIKTDVRVIAATHRDLEKMVNDGEFRNDLYYRLSAFTILLPPLRDRTDDLPLLIEHFLQRYSREFRKEVQSISEEAMELLLSYGWPGNLRELQNVLRQAILQTTGPMLIPEFLPPVFRNVHGTPTPGLHHDSEVEQDLTGFVETNLQRGSENLYAESLEMMERYLIARVLREVDGNQSKAAKILGITRGSLRNKIRSLGVSIDRTISIDGEEANEASVVE